MAESARPRAPGSTCSLSLSSQPLLCLKKGIYIRLMYSPGQNAWWIESMLEEQWQRGWTRELGLATKKNCHNLKVVVFLCGSDCKESACNAGDPGSIPGSGRSPGEGNSNPLQYSYLENPKDREAWWATYSPWGHKESDMTGKLTKVES